MVLGQWITGLPGSAWVPSPTEPSHDSILNAVAAVLKASLKMLTHCFCFLSARSPFAETDITLLPATKCRCPSTHWPAWSNRRCLQLADIQVLSFFIPVTKLPY